MEKKRSVRRLSFLIVILIIFQMIPCTLSHDEVFQNHAGNSKAFLSSSSLNTDVLYISRENQKTSVQKAFTKNTVSDTCQIIITDVSKNKILFQEVVFDYRRVIRKSIPHYFYGSKYKTIHPVI